MIGFYGDEHQNKALPTWATLSEISNTLGIEREAVRSVARRALREEELWVKKKNGKILLDTTSEMYKASVGRWLKQQQGDASSEHDADPFEGGEAEWRAQHATRQSQEVVSSLALDGHLDWPEMCAWLASQGLSVFFNLLADEHDFTLRWRWGDLQSKHFYVDVKDAVIDALDCKLNAKRPVPTILPAPPPVRPMHWTQRFWHTMRRGGWRTR